MSEPLTVFVALATLGLALFVARLHVSGHGEQRAGFWFRLMLATALRGRVEKDGGDAETWKEKVLRFVAPLKKATTDASVAEPELLADPLNAGEGYDPSRFFGQDCGWNAVAEIGCSAKPAFLAAVGRRWPVNWLFVDSWVDREEPAFLSALQATVPGPVSKLRLTDEVREERVQHLMDACREALKTNTNQLVIVAADEAVFVALQALVQTVDVRDRLAAFVGIGAVLQGDSEQSGEFGQASMQDWMETWFCHERLDTEADRWIPYLSLHWQHRGDEFPDPGEGHKVIDVLNLGALPATADLPLELFARTLVAFMGCWVLSRR